MYNHKLDYIKLDSDFECSFYQLEYDAIQRQFRNESTSISKNVIDLLREELNKIDQYFYDLYMSLEDELFVGNSFYGFYHKYFSYENADKIEDEIKNGISNMENALIVYEKDGYKIVPQRELLEDMKTEKRKCNTWGSDGTFPIVISKDIIKGTFGLNLSLEELGNLKFYNSEEDYIGEVLKCNLNGEVIREKKEEAKAYYIKCFKELSNKSGRSWEEEINIVLSMTETKVYELKKH